MCFPAPELTTVARRKHLDHKALRTTYGMPDTINETTEDQKARKIPEDGQYQMTNGEAKNQADKYSTIDFQVHNSAN